MSRPGRPAGLFALLAAACLSCAPRPSAPAASSLSALQHSAKNATDPSTLGRWLFAELVSPGGDARRAAEARQRLTELKRSDMLAELALGLDAQSHGHFKSVAGHYLRALQAARESSDPSAPLVAWYAAHEAVAFRRHTPKLWATWRPFVERALDEPKAIGWRAREELADWWRFEAYQVAQKGIDDLAARRHGCVQNLRIAGPFGRNVASDALREFAAEKPGPWPDHWDPDPGAGESPRVLKTKRVGCSVGVDEPVNPGVYYAETFIDLRADSDVLIAPQGAFALWVDDRLVARHDPRVFGTWLGLGTRLHLVQGRHRILAMIGGPVTSIRVLHTDGRSFELGGSADGRQPYSLVAPVVEPGANVFDRYLTQGRLTDPEDDLLRYLLAYLANVEGQSDVASVLIEPLVRVPARATGISLSTAASFVENDPIFAQSQRRDLVRELHERALKRDDQLWASRLALCLSTAEKSGLTEGVRQLLGLVDAFPEVPDVLTQLAGMYNELGWSSEHYGTLRKLAARFPDDPDALSAAVAALDANGDVQQADALAERVRQLDPDNEIVFSRALNRRDYPVALAELKRIAARRPERKELAERIYDVMVQSGDVKETWNKLEAAIKQDPRSERARLNLADARLARGEQDALVRALVDAVEGGSSTAMLEQALDLVEGQSELEPYRLDARSIIRAYEASHRSLPGTAARLLDYSAFWVHADGSSRMLEHEIIRVQSAEAISSMAEQPLQQGLILHLRVIKQDGQVLEPEIVEGKPTVTMPHLEVGDYIETERIESNAGDGRRGARYLGPRWFFREESIAYARSELLVISPKSKPLAIETRNDVPPPVVSESGPLVIRRWRVDDSPAAPVEPFGAPITEFLPSVQFGWGVSLEDTLRSMSDAVFDLTPVDPRILRIAEHIVEPVPPSARAERARRLYRWLLGNVQEGDESDGRRVIIGKNGNLWRGYITLCRALGIPVRYAVARNRLSLPPQGPFSASTIFGTPLLRVEGEKGPLWLSFGGKYTPFAYVPAEARGMPAYLLESEQPVLTRVPSEGALDDVRYAGTLELGADASANVDLTLSFTGKYAVGLRNALAEIPEDQLHDVLESRLLGSDLRGLELESYSLDHFDDLDSPLLIHAKGKVRNFSLRSGAVLVIPPPFGPRIAQLAALPARQTPLLIVEATHREIDLHLKLPPGARLSGELGDGTVSDGDRSVLIRDALTDGEVRLERVVNLPAGRIQPQAYPRFLEFARRADEALTRSLRVQLP